MESLPPRSQGHRRSSPAPAETTQSQPTPTSSSSESRTRSEDSQTIFVQNDQEEDANLDAISQQSYETTLQQQTHTPPSSEEPPKCWICLLDATEDTDDSSPWRSPCPCALVAHETCLLDWIADIEAPSKQPTSKPQVLCPQCKNQIRLQRPSDPLVSLFQAAERSISYTFPKAALLLLGGIVYGACAAGGIHTIYAVFGPDEGARILAPVRRNAVRAPVDAFVGTPGVAAQAILRQLREHLVHWRLYIGLPLITPTLILSRTSLADGIMPILPVLFFVTQQTVEGGELLQWPPSAEFAFAVLPYVRGLYNAWYKRSWEAKKKRWLEELQPRAGSGVDMPADPVGPAGGANNDDDEDDENIVEIRVDGGIFAEWDDRDDAGDGEDQPQNPNEDLRPARLDEEMNGADNDPFARVVPENPVAPPPQINDNRNAGAAGNIPANQREILSFSPTGIAQTVLGALIFPTLAGLAGETLKLVLPTSWLRGKGAQRTFLQAKWARTIVGGCLLVLGKDALVLYVRWKMARMQRGRKVLDFPGPRGLGRV